MPFSKDSIQIKIKHESNGWRFRVEDQGKLVKLGWHHVSRRSCLDAALVARLEYLHRDWVTI